MRPHHSVPATVAMLLLSLYPIANADPPGRATLAVSRSGQPALSTTSRLLSANAAQNQAARTAALNSLQRFRSAGGTPGLGFSTPNASFLTPGVGVPGFFNPNGVYPWATAPAGYSDGGYYLGPAQTAEGAALQGLAEVIAAEGQYNQATAAAAVDLTRAQSDALKNQVQSVQTTWAMWNIGREQLQRELGPHATPEELYVRARAAAPRSLGAAQIDPVHGTVNWPVALQDDLFQARRSAIERYADRWTTKGALNAADQTHMRQDIDAMFDLLKSQIGSIPPQDYLAAREFLQSLLYETTHAML